MQIRNNYRISVILVIGDIIAINLAFLFSYWLRFNSGLFKIVYGVPHIYTYFKVLPVLTVIMLFLLRSERLYASRKARLSIVDEFFTIVKTITIGILIFMAGTFFYREYSFSRGMLFISWFVLILFIGSWHFAVNRLQLSLRLKQKTLRNLLIIGDGPMVGRLVKHISNDPHWDYDIKGVARIKEKSSPDTGGVPVVGALEDLPRVMDDYGISEVILAETDLSRAAIMKIILECEKRMVEFRLIADLLGMVTSQVDMRSIDGIPLLGLKESPLSEGYNRFVKRAVDIILSSMAIVVLSPFFLVIAALVKLGSPGPVFYLQKRVGEDGRRFAIIKFRTMVHRAEKGVGRIWAKENDARRTPAGAFLRRYNLDELPQLANVFKGQMSLVGPRPERPHFVGRFREDIPRYMARHKIKSGITGWAQVNGLRGNTSIEERTKYDLYYVENWSLGFDLRILLMSIVATKNAY